MEHEILYSTLSDEGRRAWETISGLPLTTVEQQQHAWEILRAELGPLADDPQPSLHLLPADQAEPYDLFLSGAELAALRVMVAWVKANDRAGRLRDLPVYPDLAEALLAQLGPAPWPGVWEPAYLNSLATGGILWLYPHTQARALSQLLEATLVHAADVCPGWPHDARTQLVGLLCDVWYWLQAMLVVADA